MAISPIFSLTSPKSVIDLPNAVRPFPYCTAAPRASFDPPVVPAPSLKRPMLRMLKAILCPFPISPSRFSFGITASCRIRGRVELPLMPVFFSSAPRLTPGEPLSMMKAVKCSPSTLANVM
jgi:hypothetical protein